MSTNRFALDESPCLPPVLLDPWLPASGLGFRLSIPNSDTLLSQPDNSSLASPPFSPLSSAGGGCIQSTLHPSQTISGPSTLSSVSLPNASRPSSLTGSPITPASVAASARKHTRRDARLSKRPSTDSIGERERERRLNYLGQLNKRDSLVLIRADVTSRVGSCSDTQHSLNPLPPSSWSPSTVDSASSVSSYSDYLDSGSPSDAESSPSSSPTFPFRRAGRTRSISLTFSFEAHDIDDPKAGAPLESDQEVDKAQVKGLPQLLFSPHQQLSGQTSPFTRALRRASAAAVVASSSSSSSFSSSSSSSSSSLSPPRLIQAFSDDCDSDDDYSDDFELSFPVPDLTPTVATTISTGQNFDFRKSSGWKDIYIRSAPTELEIVESTVNQADPVCPSDEPRPERVTDDGEIGYLSNAIRHRSTPPSSLSTRAPLAAVASTERPTELGTNRVIQPMTSTVSLPSLRSSAGPSSGQRSSLPVLGRPKGEHRSFDRLAIFLNKSSTTDDLAGLYTGSSSRPGSNRAWGSASSFGGKNVSWGGQLKIAQVGPEPEKNGEEAQVERTAVVLGAPIVVEEKCLPAIPSESQAEAEPAAEKSSSSASLSSSSSSSTGRQTTRRSIDDRLPFQTTFVARAKTENALQPPKTPLLNSTELSDPDTKAGPNPVAAREAKQEEKSEVNDHEQAKKQSKGPEEDELCYCGTAYLKARLNAPVRPHLRSTHLPSLAPLAEPPRRRRRQQQQQQKSAALAKKSSVRKEKREGKPWKTLFVRSRPVQPSV